MEFVVVQIMLNYYEILILLLQVIKLLKGRNWNPIAYPKRQEAIVVPLNIVEKGKKPMLIIIIIIIITAYHPIEYLAVIK